jgi:zinc transport system ATP-binding protein
MRLSRQRASRQPGEGATLTSAGTVLEVRGLSVRFGKTLVLNDLTFEVRARTSLAIIGPNGAGKTVLLKALIGSIPFEGAVHWACGVRIGYVPQKLDLERDIPITSLDFLSARAKLARTPDVDISRIVDLVGVSPALLQHPIGTLSGGQFQRLLVAFALVGEPTVLLLDEPTAGIDEPGQERLHELVARLQHEKGLTILFISHELSVVYDYATDVLCLGRQRAYIGPPRRILTPDRLAELYGSPLGFHVHDD